MKKFTLLFLIMLLGITGVDAKSRTTTLWEGTDTGADIEIAMSKLVKGATLNLTFNWLGSDGTQFSCFWWNSSTNAWVYIKSYQWVDNGNSYSFTLTDDEFVAITSDKLCFKTEDVSKMKFAKITQTETLEPTSTGDNLLSENWTASWTAKTFAAQSSAKIGDVIRFSYSAPGGWSYFQFNILDAYGNADAFENKSSNVGASIENAADLYFEFEITNISDLKKIQNEGFGIKGDNFTLTSVQLLTYADSYGYITITIPEVGYATWSSDKKYDFKSAGLQAYYASEVATGSVSLTPMDITWDWQGYIIKGEEGNYDVLESLTTDGSYYPSTNYLKYHIDKAEVYDSGKNRYIFAKNKTGEASSVGFYKLTSNYTLAAHKAYLETEGDITSEARLVLRFEDEDDPTAIGEVKSAAQPVKADNVYYNLNGQRVEKPTKGIYILNGKKVLF